MVRIEDSATSSLRISYRKINHRLYNRYMENAWAYAYSQLTYQLFSALPFSGRDNDGLPIDGIKGSVENEILETYKQQINQHFKENI